MTVLGERLRKLRLEMKLSQGQLETYAGVSQSTISDLERGEIAPKTLTAIIGLAEYFGCSTDYLLGLTNDPSPSRFELPEHGPELLSIFRQLSPERRLEILRIAETLHAIDQEEVEQDDAYAPPSIDTILERIRRGNPPRIIGGDP